MITVDLLVAYVAWLRAEGKSEATTLMRRRLLARWLGEAPTVEDFAAFFASLRTHGTAAMYAGFLRNFYRWAVTAGHLEVNPLEGLRLDGLRLVAVEPAGPVKERRPRARQRERRIVPLRKPLAAELPPEPLPTPDRCPCCGEPIAQEPLPGGFTHVPGCWAVLHDGPASPIPTPPSREQPRDRYAGYRAAMMREIEELAAHAELVLSRAGRT
jgi:hypothetical protein